MGRARGATHLWRPAMGGVGAMANGIACKAHAGDRGDVGRQAAWIASATLQGLVPLAAYEGTTSHSASIARREKALLCGHSCRRCIHSQHSSCSHARQQLPGP